MGLKSLEERARGVADIWSSESGGFGLNILSHLERPRVPMEGDECCI